MKSTQIEAALEITANKTRGYNRFKHGKCQNLPILHTVFPVIVAAL